MGTRDSKDLIVNEHTSNRPIFLFVKALLKGLVITAGVVGLGIMCLVIGTAIVYGNKGLAQYAGVGLALFCAGLAQFVTVFLTSRK